MLKIIQYNDTNAIVLDTKDNKKTKVTKSILNILTQILNIQEELGAKLNEDAIINKKLSGLEAYNFLKNCNDNIHFYLDDIEVVKKTTKTFGLTKNGLKNHIVIQKNEELLYFSEDFFRNSLLEIVV